ncbi:MAG: putative Ig domain-containing protein, partial [Actinomycetota bacterium]
ALVGGGRPTAEGGAGGYTFSAPDLPAGLSMAADGEITGTPTVDGRFYVTVEVEDSNSATTSTIHVLDVAAADQEGRFEIYPDSTASFSYPSITPDGRFMAIDTGDTLAGEDEVDIIDRDTDQIVASFTARGFGHPDGVVHLSDDGRYATYYSEGTVYQHDLLNAVVTAIASDVWWFGIAASDDGSVVAFYSNVGELETPVDPLGDAAGPYVWDRATGTFERIAAGLGTPVPSAESMSADGASIAVSQNLAVYPVVEPSDGYLWDAETDSTTSIGETERLFVSGDGSVVVFSPEPGFGGLVAWDRASDQRTVIVSTSDFAANVQVSDDGRYVTFDSPSDGLVPGDTNGVSDLFQWDAVTETLTRITDGGFYGMFDAAADGGVVVFSSADPDLTGDVDLNDPAGSAVFRLDLFIWRRDGDVYERVTQSVIGVDVKPVGITPDGRLVWFYRRPTAAFDPSELVLWNRGEVYS